MTNDEAIDVLYVLEGVNEELGNKGEAEALRMAINALTAQPETHEKRMETHSVRLDTISRQAAIDALDVLCQEHRYRIPGKSETYSQYNEAWQDALDRAEGAIGNLPSAQPEIMKWIPCKDRLPEQEQRVLINLSDGDTSVGWLLRGNIWFTDYSYGKPEDEVIAWMPLPECYRGENDG